jgi:hypothetical protein
MTVSVIPPPRPPRDASASRVMDRRRVAQSWPGVIRHPALERPAALEHVGSSNGDCVVTRDAVTDLPLLLPVIHLASLS